MIEESIIRDIRRAYYVHWLRALQKEQLHTGLGDFEKSQTDGWMTFYWSGCIQSLDTVLDDGPGCLWAWKLQEAYE